MHTDICLLSSTRDISLLLHRHRHRRLRILQLSRYKYCRICISSTVIDNDCCKTDFITCNSAVFHFTKHSLIPKAARITKFMSQNRNAVAIFRLPNRIISSYVLCMNHPPIQIHTKLETLSINMDSHLHSRWFSKSLAAKVHHAMCDEAMYG